MTLGDDLLRLTVFWCIFLPLGKHYTYERRSWYPPSGRWGHEQVHCSLASAGLIIQFFWFYFGGALLRSGEGGWGDWKDGTALFYLFQVSEISSPMATVLISICSPRVFMLLNSAFVWWEFTLPFIFLVPVSNTPLLQICTFIRLSAILSIWIVAAISYLLISQGLTFFAPCVVSLTLLPTAVFLDSEQSTTVAWKLKAEKLYLPTCKPTRRKASKLHRCLRNVENTFLFLMVLLVVLWNVSNILSTPWQVLPRYVRILGYIIRFDQCWDLFVPHPQKEHGWWLATAVTGAEMVPYDLLRSEPVSRQKKTPKPLHWRWQRSACWFALF